MAWPGRACTKLKLAVVKKEASPQTIIKVKIIFQQNVFKTNVVSDPEACSWGKIHACVMAAYNYRL